MADAAGNQATETLPVFTSNTAVTPQIAPNVAFAARVAEQTAGDPATEDVFVSSSSPKPENSSFGATGYVEVLRKAIPSQQSGSESHSDAQHRGSSHQDSIAKLLEVTVDQGARPDADERLLAPIPTTLNSGADRSQPSPSEVQSPNPENHRVRVAEEPFIDPRIAQPVKDLTVRLTADNHHVDVKLIDRGGELHVAVHSADPILTTDLRASVHDLIRGLEKNGFRAEAWQPGDSPRHPSDYQADGTRNTNNPQRTQTGEDPRQQGRNAHQPEYSSPRRSRASRTASNTEWINQISALTGAERDK